MAPFNAQHDMTKTADNWSLYIIEASDASLYTGITTDLERRFREHLNGPGGARYFNGRRPLRIVYHENGHSRASASRREAELKKLSRAAKQRLVAEAQQAPLTPGTDAGTDHE